MQNSCFFLIIGFAKVRSGERKNPLYLNIRTILQPTLARACLHKGGGTQVGEVTCGGLPHLTFKRDHIKMRDYMDRQVTPPKQVTSPTWGSPPPCKQAFRHVFILFVLTFFITVVNFFHTRH